MDRLVIISGCSGGGKSTLLQEMAHRGYAVVEEPGRRIIAEEREGHGSALPWVNLAAFAERAVALSLEDRARAKNLRGPVFFDRGLIDAAAALEFATGRPVLQKFAAERFNRRVFMTPPWPEIYVMDADRRHGLDEAMNEYERLLSAYSALDYDVRLLPKVPVAERADLIAGALGLT